MVLALLVIGKAGAFEGPFKPNEADDMVAVVFMDTHTPITKREVEGPQLQQPRQASPRHEDAGRGQGTIQDTCQEYAVGPLAVPFVRQ